MDDGRPILLHLGGGVLDVSPWATAARRMTDKLDFSSCINAEGPLAVSHGTKTLAGRAGVIPVTDDDPNTNNVVAHRTSSWCVLDAEKV
jgi:hypothetical protein